MATQIDPAAYQNAFYANQDWLARGRQEQAQTAQNRLAQMYAANQDARAASAEQRAQAGFDANQQANASQIDVQAMEQVAGWASNLLSRQDIDDNTRVQIVQQAVQNPATADVLKRAGVAQIDWSNPQQVIQGIRSAAGWGQQSEQSRSGWVQSAQVLANGNIGYLTREGKLVDTGQKAKEQLQIVQQEGAPAIANLRTGGSRFLSTPEQERQAAAANAGSVASGKSAAERNAEFVDAGISAADAISTVRRGLELLKGVETGGLDSLKLKASNIFGVTGADEGELSANLGKSVLAQLRSTFGAAFTEKEGERLAQIEAGFGKSTEANKRLLEQTERILDRAARRGLAAAEAAGDEFSAKEIRDAMKFTLTPGANSQKQTQGVNQPPQQSGWGKAVEVK